MTREAINQKIGTFISDLDILTDAIGWGIDKRIRISIAAQFSTSKKELDAKEFLLVSNYIKKELKWFSNLQKEMRFALAALLITHFEEPIQAFDELKNCYDVLVMNGFRKGPYTYLAAYSFLSCKHTDGNRMEQAKRAMEVYKAIKSRHFFLTSNDDYPLSVLLSQKNHSVEEQIEDTEYYYHYLGDRVYRKGNDLQFLSHILTYGQEDKREAIAVNSIKFFQEFQNQSIKIKGIHYPALGVLALIEKPENAVSDIVTIYSLCNKTKSLRWYKDMNFLLAIQMFVQDKIVNKDILSIGLVSNIQAILQAQDAASIAAISAATVAVDSSSN